jgi:hypothetical protein
MNLDKDSVINSFVQEIREKFPDVGARMDAWLAHLGFEPEDKAYTSMFEAFSQATTDAIKLRDKNAALKHLTFMSQKLKGASDVEREYIDVYYVEPLLWDIRDNELKKWGWSLMPKNLQALYAEVWDEPRSASR